MMTGLVSTEEIGCGWDREREISNQACQASELWSIHQKITSKGIPFTNLIDLSVNIVAARVL